MSVFSLNYNIAEEKNVSTVQAYFSFPNLTQSGKFLKQDPSPKRQSCHFFRKKPTSVAQRGNAVTTAMPISALLRKSWDHLSPLYFTVHLTQLGIESHGTDGVSEGQVWKLHFPGRICWFTSLGSLFPGAADSHCHLSPLKSQFCVLLPHLMS